MLNHLAKAALKGVRDYRYHTMHAKQASAILRELKGAGKRIRPADAKRCKDYAIEVLRDEKFSPWLMVYAAVSGQFKEGWIPDNFYGAKVVPAINGKSGRVAYLKSLSGALLDTQLIPDLGSRINGAFFDTGYHQLSFDEARSHFFEGDDRVVFKADNSLQGAGIRFYDEASFDRTSVDRAGDGVFQRAVRQHAFFDRFAKAVATIRLTTAVEESGEIRARAGYLRLGTGDDTHVQSKSHVRVPIDLGRGTLWDKGLLANWRECSTHPTSKETFGGRELPSFDTCVSSVVELHRQIPFVRSVGWDVTVDSDGQVQVLEWNGHHNDIKFSEATQGPCFLGLRWERFA
jgi:hypothetical protein